VDFTGASLVGIETGDVVDIDTSAYSANFDTKNVGTGTAVTVTGVALSGTDAGNYSLTQPSGLTADITAKELTATANNKVYDSTTAATFTLHGIESGDVVTPVATANFDTANVGTGKAVTVTGLITLSGAAAGNYTVAQPVDPTANITTRPITATAANKSKVFGTADPALTYSVTSGSLVGGDSFSGALTRAAGEAVGTYPITQGTLALSANYNLSFVGATFTITTADKPVSRIGGSNRFDVTVATAQQAYPGWTGVKHVVLASGEDRAQPDALTAAGLAGVLDAPLMLVPYSSMNTSVENAIKGMPAGVKVHIVGGPNSVSTRVESQLRGYGNVASVDRTSGSDRYGTAAAVARRMKTELVAQGKTLPSTTLITNGNFPNAMFDALTASAISAHNYFPVLLVRDGSVPGSTSGALADLGLTNRYIIGGTTSVKNSVASNLGVSAGNRISGPNRYSTATAAANRAKSEGWLSNTLIGFAAKVPDAATGGAFMGKNDGALVYVTSKAVPGDTANYLSANKASITQGGVVFGGTTSIPESVRTQLYNLLK
jgi:putative cell wall-binding protein